MPRYSRRSKKRLQTCDFRLQLIFGEIIKFFDHMILEGHRDRERQNELFKRGFTKVKWPNSKHNSYPSKAIDAAPYPVRWPKRSIKDFPEEIKKDMEALLRFYYFAGLVKGAASVHGIDVRWGGDWDGDNIFTDQAFFDLVHFELDDEVKKEE